jgi:hypothetical protein
MLPSLIFHKRRLFCIQTCIFSFCSTTGTKAVIQAPQEVMVIEDSVFSVGDDAIEVSSQKLDWECIKSVAEREAQICWFPWSSS